MVGAGLVKPPENCFRDAVSAFADAYGAELTSSRSTP